VRTAIIVTACIVVVLLFIWWSARFITRRVQQGEGHSECSFCGSPLEQIGIEYSTHCTACGRRQPWDTGPEAE
jgi:cytochrome bd-type quinol oxidase subunit 1